MIVTLLGINENSIQDTATVTVLDTIAPVADVETLADITAECEVTEPVSYTHLTLPTTPYV